MDTEGAIDASGLQRHPLNYPARLSWGCRDIPLPRSQALLSSSSLKPPTHYFYQACFELSRTPYKEGREGSGAMHAPGRALQPTSERGHQFSTHRQRDARKVV